MVSCRPTPAGPTIVACETVHSIQTVLSTETGAAIAGTASLGHIVPTVGCLILFLINLGKKVTESPAAQGTPETPSIDSEAGVGLRSV